jgi:hypothetical protein
MVAIWEPTYFYSSWCLSEWQSFQKRAEMINRERQKLVVPMKIHRNLPANVKSFHVEDFTAYATSFWEAFQRSPKVLDFEDRLKAFAGIVAGVVRDAPNFQDWPIEQVPSKDAPVIPLEKL